MYQLFKITILVIVASSCKPKENKEAAQGDWIKGTETGKLQIIEEQLRGFDMAMVEKGYRYQELYWAGKDENWEYADYQVEKIRKAIENGLQRRPKRAASAEHFLKVALPEMKQVAESKDTVEFLEGFQMLTANCNACHAMEKVSHFSVQEPLYRQSPIRRLK